MRKKEPQLVIPQKEPDTIGHVFDYYSDLGHDKLPDLVTINSDKFNSQPKNKKHEREQNQHRSHLQKHEERQ